jgi:hypothetical protein
VVGFSGTPPTKSNLFLTATDVPQGNGNLGVYLVFNGFGIVWNLNFIAESYSPKTTDGYSTFVDWVKSAPQVSAVPIPSAALLFGPMLLVFLRLRLKRHS